MIYRVMEGETILWPDGSVRASSGEVFDGFNSGGTPAGHRHASALLFPYRNAIFEITPGAGDVIRRDMPEDMMHPGWQETDLPKPKKAKAKPKAKPKADSGPDHQVTS